MFWLVRVLMLAGVVVMFASGDAKGNEMEQLGEMIRGPMKAHPRLFFSGEETEGVRGRIESEALPGEVFALLRAQADAMLELPAVERRQEGRRLLGVSRTVLKRVSYLAFVYRITGERKYLEGAEREMLAAAGFSDWNPSHFLDVAEMTAGMAIGYDWLYEDLSEESRRTIRDAIVGKGLEVSIDNDAGWVRSTNNWAQVCHAGMVLGALAVMEDEPELAERTMGRMLENIHRPMDHYGPNGGYSEGPTYWNYGTSFNVLLIDGLASALGTDFGLSEHERFMASAGYYLHTHGPTLEYFSYSDSGTRAGVSEAMYWFARRLGRPELLWMERRKLAEHLRRGQQADGSSHRLLPFLLVWAGDAGEVEAPAELHYRDDGPTPVTMHRSGWDESAVYVGLKAGTPSAGHAHMDIGSFVMDADGLRWAVDLGMENYTRLEAAGMPLWSRGQDGGRWTVFRYNNRSHNTLVVNDELQRVEGFSRIVKFSDEGEMPHSVIDMGEVYAGQLAEARRGVGLLGDRGVIVQDELRAVEDEAAEVRWGMVTRGEVEIAGDGRAVLRQGEKALGLEVVEPAGVKLELYETATPPDERESPNPGTVMIGFKTRLEAGESGRLVVVLRRGGLGGEAVEVKPFSEW
jgi:hypothetical protein